MNEITFINKRNKNLKPKKKFIKYLNKFFFCSKSTLKTPSLLT